LFGKIFVSIKAIKQKNAPQTPMKKTVKYTTISQQKYAPTIINGVDRIDKIIFAIPITFIEIINYHKEK
jgi:hypothetical protein